MARKAETAFKKIVMDELKTFPNTWFEKIQQASISGTPDILACINGFFVAIELKARPVDKVSPMQAFKLDLIKKAKGVSLVVHPQNAIKVMVALRAMANGELAIQEKMVKAEEQPPQSVS